MKPNTLTKTLTTLAKNLDAEGLSEHADLVESYISYISKVAADEKTLFLIRGISGSGKSTLAKNLVDGDLSKIFSTDDFFSQEGKYNFNPSKLGQAHGWNQSRAQKAMESGLTPIVIDNTNTQKWEARPYVEFAKKHGYRVEVVETTTPWRFDAEELAKKNIHGVPMEGIKRMIDRYEPMEEFTTENILTSKAPWEK